VGCVVEQSGFKTDYFDVTAIEFWLFCSFVVVINLFIKFFLLISSSWPMYCQIFLITNLYFVLSLILVIYFLNYKQINFDYSF
jgi:hypothetical protein